MKIATLEYARFVLSLLVFAYHLPLFGIQKIAYVGDSGFFAVLAFMCLSGVVLWHRQSNSNSIRDFITRRFFRLYPLHLLSLLIMLLISIRLQTPYREADFFHVLLHITLLHGSGIEQFGTLNAPSWAVSTEFIAATVLVYTFVHKVSTLKRIALLLLMIISFQGGIIDSRISLCCSALLAGTFVYDASTMMKVEERRTSYILTITASIMFLSIVTFRICRNRFDYDSKTALFISESYLIDLILISILFYLLLTKIFINRECFTKVGRILGGGAYGIYLFHIPVLTTVQQSLKFENDSLREQITFLGVSCISLVTVVILMHNYVEKPCINWCNNLLSRKRFIH